MKYKAIKCAGIASAAAAVALSLSVTASASNDTAASKAPPVTITVGVSTNLINAPLYVGAAQGIYLKNGINLKIASAASATNLLGALVAGQYQFGTLGWGTAVPAVVQGAKLEMITPVQGSPYEASYDNQIAIIGAPGITKVAQLKGKAVGVSLGGTVEEWFLAQLQKVGLSQSDVSMVNVPFPDMPAALESGSISAAVTAEPYGFLSLADISGSKILVRGGDLVDTRSDLFGETAWIKAHPKVVEEMDLANLEASQFVREHPSQAVTDTSEYIPGIPTAVMTAALKVIDFDPRWSSKILRGFKASNRSLISTGVIKSAPNPNSMLDVVPLEKIIAAKPSLFKDLKKGT